MSEEPSLADLLGQANRGLRRRWATLLEPWSLSPHQWRALRTVAHRDGPRLAELADSLRIAPRSATDVVDGLEERGLVERSADPIDRRALLVRLTDAGHQMQTEVDKARTEDLRDYFGRLTPSERDELARLLGKLLE